ncbi:MAG: addiction module protein [Betaproteobacteria bacterium]|nr:addiction module protein [Betaproteobacteria bacterium]
MHAKSDTDIAEILKSPVEERLRLVELIRESPATDPSGVPPGEAHRAVIDERLAEHARDPATSAPPALRDGPARQKAGGSERQNSAGHQLRPRR